MQTMAIASRPDSGEEYPHSTHPHQSSGTEYLGAAAHQPPRRLSEDGEAQQVIAYLGRAARVKQGRMEKLDRRRMCRISSCWCDSYHRL